jgi:hypothetical protein
MFNMAVWARIARQQRSSRAAKCRVETNEKKLPVPNWLNESDRIPIGTRNFVACVVGCIQETAGVIFYERLLLEIHFSLFGETAASLLICRSPFSASSPRLASSIFFLLPSSMIAF